MLKDFRRGCRGSRCCISFFLVCAAACSLFAPAIRAQDEGYCAEVLASARGQRLHEDQYWHVLLHYQNGMFGVESIIDDPRFFLAPDGKTNPRSELEATIRAFFSPADDEKDSAVCRFTARYEWIRERLNLDTGRLPRAECRSFMDFMDSIRPEAVSLVFPMAHLNSPASMYGHTLLMIETANRSKLLAYSVSYSAVTGETFGPAFALKSMVGLYPGLFSVLPYYAKLQEYSDVDHRDIWEYPLNLTKPEIRRMLLHIRELESIASDYYFFDENCSYLLMSLLEAARPTVRLTDQVHGWLIPLDSIRMIEEQGMIAGAHYRPSRTTKISCLASRLPGTGQDRALSLADGDEGDDPFGGAGIPDQEKRETLELASEYLQYRYTRSEVSEETYQERLLRILQARSRLGVSETREGYQVPVPVRPERGHRSNRLAFGFGSKRSEAFGELRIRPAYHSLMDNDDGYIKGAHLVFADTALRYLIPDNKLRLERLDLVDITSLTPRDRFFHPISWKVRTGFCRIADEDDEDTLVYQLNCGAGFTFRDALGSTAYAMFETGLYAGGVLEDNYAAGAGGSAGVLHDLSDWWKIHLFLRDISYGLGDRFNDFEATAQQTFTFQADQGISLDVSRRKTREFYHTEAAAMWNLFF